MIIAYEKNAYEDINLALSPAEYKQTN